MNFFPLDILQPLAYGWLKVNHPKVCEDNCKMMCEITCLEGFGQIMFSIVVLPIISSMTSLEYGMPKNPKTFQTLIVIIN
jgi:hypothetical protein